MLPRFLGAILTLSYDSLDISSDPRHNRMAVSQEKSNIRSKLLMQPLKKCLESWHHTFLMPPAQFVLCTSLKINALLFTSLARKGCCMPGQYPFYWRVAGGSRTPVKLRSTRISPEACRALVRFIIPLPVSYKDCYLRSEDHTNLCIAYFHLYKTLIKSRGLVKLSRHRYPTDLSKIV